MTPTAFSLRQLIPGIGAARRNDFDTSLIPLRDELVKSMNRRRYRD